MSTEQNDGKSPFEVMEDPIEMEFNDFVDYNEEEQQEEIEDSKNLQNNEQEINIQQEDDHDKKDDYDEEDDYNEEDNYDDEDEETGAAILLKEYVNKGLVDADVKNDLSGEELMEILDRNAYNKALRDLETQGYNEDVKKAIEFLRSGGTPEELQSMFESASYSELDISDDYNLDNREKVIKQYHREKGIPEKKIDQLYRLSVENDETYEDAVEAQEYFREKDNEMLQIKIKQREEQERAWVEAQEANRRYVDEVLAKGNINGVVISKYEADKLKKFIYDESELVKVKEGGKEKVVKTTGYNLKLREYENNPEWQLIFSKLLMNNFDFSKFSKDIKKQRDNEILDTFNAKLNKKAIKNHQNVYKNGTNSNKTLVTELNI